ncbi:MAG: UDP-N-acetylmuramate--L-alanine ligase [Oscillospiraceae bacterium]
MIISDLEKYMKPGVHCHLIGIGGVSMSPLAEVLFGQGLLVTGSDMNDGPSVQHLRSLGIPVTIGHHAENIKGARFIVRTAAARDDNVEVIAARDAGIPVFERAEGWGYIMRRFKNAVCISGTHGKTTTTSMVTHILMAAKKDPTVMIGGTLPLLGSGHRVGGGDTIVLESCEYYNSFLNFSPTIAVVLNIEADHLDFFRDLEDVKSAFRRFASLVPEDTGIVVANNDDKNTMDALAGLKRRIITFGFSENAEVRAVNIRTNEKGSSFDVLHGDSVYTHIRLEIPGVHNVKNALAAAASAISLGIPSPAVLTGLACFTGAGRRFERKGEYNGAQVYDDYAHHPGELHALFDAVSTLGYKRIIIAFQPHTYTRTKALFNDFVRELSRADIVFLAEIYAAREKNTLGISSKDVADRIPGADYCSTFAELEDKLRKTASPGDIILTVGAGDIFRVGEQIVKT